METIMEQTIQRGEERNVAWIISHELHRAVSLGGSFESKSALSG